MHEEGHLDVLDLDAALTEDLPSKVYALPQGAPHLLAFQKLSNKSNKAKFAIDPQLQSSVAAVMNQLHEEWSQNDVHNAGCLVLNTKTGEVIVYHGNIPKTLQERSVDVIQAKRSSGSILKPFLYAHMLEDGLITPRQLVWDIPTYYAGFHPSNYNKTYAGGVAADEALQRSLNVPFVRMLHDYGVSPFLEKLAGHEITTLHRSADHYGLSLILGGGEVTLWEITHAYRNMGAASLGGDVPQDLSRASLYMTLDALKGLNRPDEEGDWQRMHSRAPIAWKTGTSYGHRDAWAIGVHPDITIGVWVGNADGEGREGIIGSKTAGRMLFAVAGKSNLSTRWFREPLTEMKHLRKCHHSGMLASTACPDAEEVLWPDLTEHACVCAYHVVHAVDEARTWSYDGVCGTTDDLVHQAYFDLPPSVAVYYKRNHPDWSPIPPRHPECRQSGDDRYMDMIYPRKGEEVYLPKDLNADQQTLVARVSHTRQDATLFWYLDDRFMGETKYFHSYSFLPKEGNHTITVVDETGFQLSREVLVKGG